MKFILLLSLVACFDVKQDENARQDSGFIPYRLETTNRVKDGGIVAGATIASTVLPMFMSLAGGFFVGAVLGLAAFSYATRESWDDPVAAYAKIWGKVEKQIAGNINSKAVAVMTERLRTLSINVHDQNYAYMAELGVATKQDMINNPVGPLVMGTTVDKYMKSLDNLLTASNDWAKYTPIDPQNPEYSIFLNAGKFGEKKCLHTKGNKIEDGTVVVVDEQCELHNLADKLWSIDVQNRLILRTTLGDKCLSFRTKRFRKSLKQPIAIYSLDSKQCTEGRNIKIKLVDNQYSLFDGSRMICVGSGKKDLSNALVSTEKGNRCHNDNKLGFLTRIPIPITAAQGTLVPAQSFDEMGVQIMYMPTLAAIHLGALKEMYLHGTQTGFAQEQFEVKKKEYMNFLDTNLPIFADYATFRGLKVDEYIQAALGFYGQLEKASLQFAPATVQIG